MHIFLSPIQDKKQKLQREIIKLNVLFTYSFCLKYVVEGPKYNLSTTSEFL